MAIYLHPIDEKPQAIVPANWVEIDLVTWKNNDSAYPVGLTLLRRLDSEIKQPYLQELMFKSLYQGLPIKKLTLEIPHGLDDDSVCVHILENVKVTHYTIHPANNDNKKTYEKITLVAESQLKNTIAQN